MSASRCVYVIYLFPQHASQPASPFCIVCPFGLLNGQQARLAICKPSQLNCVCNSPSLLPACQPAGPTKLPATCMHWLNLPKDARRTRADSLNDLSMHFACRSYAPPTPRIGRCMWNMRSHVTAASTSAKWIRSQRFRWHSAWMS